MFEALVSQKNEWMEGSEGGQAYVLRLSILSQNIGRDELCECFKIS